MTTRKRDTSGDRVALLQGTLDLIVLRTLLGGTQHGQGIASAIQRTSREALLVDHGSLYPALQRLEAKRWIRATWGTTANNREARFYDLTALGRKQLVREVSEWEKLTRAVALILDPENSGG